MVVGDGIRDYVTGERRNTRQLVVVVVERANDTVG